MHFWSEGLGDGELVMGLARAKTERKGEVVALTGVIDSPAPWEYEVKIQLDDWKTILRIATSATAMDFVAAHAGWRQIAEMAMAIVKFVGLLAFYRFLALLGSGGHAPVVAATIEQSGGRKS